MSTQPVCPRCRTVYGSGRPAHFASDPRCAFKSGVFDTDNWQCATANAVREICDRIDYELRTTYSEDQRAQLLPLDDGRFLVVGWYKSRGRTEALYVLNETKMSLARLGDVENAINTALRGRA